VTSALSKLNITSPRSAKRKANHFYSPYAPSKRRSSSATATMRKVSFSQAETVPLRRAASLEAATNVDVETVVVPQIKPWGVLVSQTEGKPDVSLVRTTTELGELLDNVDCFTGERQRVARMSPIGNVANKPDCRVFQTSRTGIKAFKPVSVNGKTIADGQWLPLQPNQTFMLMDDDLSPIAEYEFKTLS
jgi:hypothetical protein